MSKPISFLFKELLFNGHPQSLGAAGVTYLGSYFIYNKPSGVELLILIYCLYQLVFLFDRYHDMEQDEKTNSVRTKHIKAYYKQIPYILVFLLFVTLFIIIRYSTVEAFLLAVFVGLVGILYPLYGKRVTRYIPLFKNIYVSAAYLPLVVFPYVHRGLAYSSLSSLLLFAAFVFMGSFLGQVILDTKDIDSDGEDGLKTLGVLLGGKKALHVILLSSFMQSGIFWIIATNSSLPSSFNLILIFDLILNLISIGGVLNRKIWGYLIAAAKFFLWSVFFFAINIIVWT